MRIISNNYEETLMCSCGSPQNVIGDILIFRQVLHFILHDSENKKELSEHHGRRVEDEVPLDALVEADRGGVDHVMPELHRVGFLIIIEEDNSPTVIQVNLINWIKTSTTDQFDDKEEADLIDAKGGEHLAEGDLHELMVLSRLRNVKSAQHKLRERERERENDHKRPNKGRQMHPTRGEVLNSLPGE